MAYCSKCGAELSSGDVFCRQCGFRNEIAGDGASEAQDAVVAPVMTKEESIAFAEKLGEQYKSYERIMKEIEDNKAQLSMPEPGMVKQHSAFKFFWPYLIYAVVSLNVCYLIANFLSRSTGLALFFLLLALVLPVVFLIVGGTSSRRRRDELNQLAVSAANNRRKHLDELKGETAALERKAAKKASELKEYQSIIPLAYRNSASMAKAVLLLRSNKAETFTDAVDLLRKV